MPLSGPGALDCVSLPVERVVHEEARLFHVLLATRLLSTSEASAQLETLRKAMTTEGHPGPEAFAALVASLAAPV